MIELDADVVDPDNDSIVYTTLPPKDTHTSTNNSNFWSECLFPNGKQVRDILDAPGFPAPLPQPPLRYHIGPSAHGLGMFATEDIKFNDLILAERPLMVYPVTMPLYYLEPQTAELGPAQERQKVLDAFEMNLSKCVERMTPEAQAAFFALTNSRTKDGSHPITGIAQTNAFMIQTRLPGDEQDCLSGVFATTSRVNHSCTPNVFHRFDALSFSLSVYAIRPIKAGEEMFTSYCNVAVPTSERQEILRKYGFECVCDVCTDPDSDALLARILSSMENDTSSTAEQMLQHSIKWMKIIEDAKWVYLRVYHLHLLRAAELSKWLKRPGDVKKYMALYNAWINPSGR
ncbi:hypothetical protein H0H87_007122 [Tephrocybe sp. NHM501043]|nr:hypothetical protein H0H87_007122 [Tephrocybe sp. NHM501043]